MAPKRRKQSRPRVIDGSRPSLEIEKLIATMDALEGYIESYLVATEGPRAGPAVSDEALDVRVASL